MLNRGSKSSLRLNSYKIDTDALQSSLRELNDMKEQLQTTISFYKNHEEELGKENERLKEQISILQKAVSVKPDHSKCLQRYVRLENQLKDQKKQFSKYRQMYEKQKKVYNELKLEMNRMKENNSREELRNVELIENYKQRTMSLESQLKQYEHALKQQKYRNQKHLGKKQSQRESNNESSSVVSDYEDNNSRYSRSYENRNFEQSESFNTKAVSKNNTLYQYNLPSNNQIRQISSKNPSEGIDFSYTASYLPNEEDEETFNSAIRKIYHEVKDLGISGRKIIVLPQFKKMSQTKNPSRKDLANFFRSPPIEEKNEHNIQKSLNYLENLVKNKYGRLSGQFITEILIKKIQEYENLEQLNTDDLEISGMTPSNSHSGLGSSVMRNQFSSKRSIGDQGKMANSYGRPSMLDYLKIQSSKFMGD